MNTPRHKGKAQNSKGQQNAQKGEFDDIIAENASRGEEKNMQSAGFSA